MIPSVVARQVRQGIEDFLRTTYPPAEPFFAGVLDGLLAEEGAVFKGPYVSVKLPFRPGEVDGSCFPDIPLKFRPYRHQELAFKRLGGVAPRSTLIATGTGSGKTECFMYPLLDHCYRHREKRGVKAIIIYPMNALATDQARRFAREIAGNEKLKGNVTAGLFIGGQDSGEGSKSMQEDMVITCKDTMRTYPPDILMTNYKMLDYLLLRAKDYSLWQCNDADMLRYVVVDELHTFDGAQGSDLACLLRRLLCRLGTPVEQVCFVGTSATLGDGDGAKGLLEFAGELFGAPLDADGVIREDVLRPGEFTGDDVLIRYHQVPGEANMAALRSEEYAGQTEYVRAQCRLWFNGWVPAGDDWDEAAGLELGRKLMEHQLFQNFIRILNGQTVAEIAVRDRLEQVLPEYSSCSDEYKRTLLDSLVALISMARGRVQKLDGSYVIQPFLQVRLQVWLRELRRMVVSVEQTPRLRYADDLRPDEKLKHLPILHCRACGRMGWLSTKGLSDECLSHDLDKIYSAFFSQAPTVNFVYQEDVEEGAPGQQLELPEMLCGRCLHYTYKQNVKHCSACGADDAMVQVRTINPRVTTKSGKVHVYSNCPHCGGHGSLTVLGSRSASLISVAISQLFASIYNDDRKLLAFSDSVQDASHRAGFFGARTYRFNMRMAIQQALGASDGTDVKLSELPARFVEYWMAKLGSKEAFVAQFIAPDMQWLKEYEEFEKTGCLDEKGELFELIDRRIHWEVFSEYGHSARIGRTLEKSGCSIARLDGELLERWAAEVQQKVQEDLGDLRSVEALQFRRLLAGLVRMCRVRGGIWAEYLVPYMASGGNAWLLKNTYLVFMPAHVSTRRSPAFIMDGAGGGGRLDPLVGSGTSPTAYEQWLVRCLGNVALNWAADIYRVVMSNGVELEVFRREETAGGAFVYGLNPENLEVVQEVDQYVCSRTGLLVSAARDETGLWEGMPSERYDVKAATLTRKPEGVDYYGQLYQRGVVCRTIPKEHTGLLERGEREKLETDFIEGDGAPYPNLLSCTPTLEMGINIGELSTVILCSVPPTESNYLQRIGRSGRQDGNSFNLVVATRRPHDLHFYEEPQEMISGQVEAPGVFLSAPAVLERQLTAFCFDRWILAVGGDPTVVPLKLGAVLNQVKKGGDRTKFPYNLQHYIDLHRVKLLEQFFALFGEVLTEDTRRHLRAFMCGGPKEKGSLDWKIIDRLQQVVNEREDIRTRLRRLRERIKRNEANPARDAVLEEELDDLKSEKVALHRVVRNISNRHAYNFFTDEGLLPNYAFPEAGVSLRSVIFRKKKTPDEQGNYEVWTHEYERPAGAAIMELAPGNSFYVDGRKLEIDQIDMSVSPVEQWRFCGACSHAELEAQVKQKASCPKCGSPSWGDAAMVRNLVRMKQMIATQSDQSSRSYDDSDDREPVFFNRHMLADVDRAFVEKAYRLQDEQTPFGFEFLRKAVFREVNFGKKELFEEDEISLAGRKVSRQGFRLCEKCGRIEKDERAFKHAIDCLHYGKPLEKGMIECLYLYREFESEAIRLLLPLGDADVESRLPSFIAALYMGLNCKYKGNVSHLQALVTDEPIPETDMRKRYLVLYDQIPGGTGYLKELMRTPEAIMELLQEAFDVLKGCACGQDTEKDGCYKCLYAYRVSRDIPQLSRKAAMEILEMILRGSRDMTAVDSVEDISVNALFESELEARFIEALRRCGSEKIPVQLREQVVRGKAGYFLSVNGHSYEMVPQVSVNESDGVEVPSRVDFMLYPMRPEKGMRPVAVFTDGFSYHADPKAATYRLQYDLAQRMALVRSGHFFFWSITYDDVMRLFDDHSMDYRDNLHPEGMDAMVAKYIEMGCLRDIYSAPELHAVGALVQFLGNPHVESWRLLVFLYGLTLKRRGTADVQALEGWQRVMMDGSVNCAETIDFSGRSAGDYFWSGQVLTDQGDVQRTTMVAQAPQAGLRANDTASLNVCMRIEDYQVTVKSHVFKRSWNAFLNGGNLLQFLPDMVMVSRRFLMEDLTVPERMVQKDLKSATVSVTSAYGCQTQDDLRELLCEEAQHLIDWIVEQGLPLPEVGYELQDDGGCTVAEAECAWEELQCAVMLEESQDKATFEAAGWKVCILAELESSDALVSFLGMERDER